METTKIKVYATKNEQGQPIVRSVGPHKATYQEYASLSSAKRAAKRLQNNPEALRKFHFGR